MPEQWTQDQEQCFRDEVVRIVSIMGTTEGSTPITAELLQLLRVRWLSWSKYQYRLHARKLYERRPVQVHLRLLSK